MWFLVLIYAIIGVIRYRAYAFVHLCVYAYAHAT